MVRVKRKRSQREHCAGALADRIDEAREDSKGNDSFLGSKAHPGNTRGVKSAGPQHGQLLHKSIARAGGAEVAKDSGARNWRTWGRQQQQIQGDKV